MNFTTNLEVDLNKSNVISEITPEKIILWKKVISEILDKTHNQFQKKEIVCYPNNLNPDRINFACPICGDSKKNFRKKRGNIYLENLYYHCFNDDCMTHMSLKTFFENFGYTKILDEGDINRINSIEFSIKKDIDLNSYYGIKKYLFNREFIKEKLGFKEIQNNSELDLYLKNRFQKNYINFLEEEKSGNLIILNCDSSGEIVISFQVRTMKEKTNTENKYLTFSYSKILSFLHLPFHDEVEKIDKISNYFGILKVNWNDYINVFEGPLDSFLLPNSIALCSLNNEFNIDCKKRYFYDYDKAAKNKFIDKIKNKEFVFLWKKVEKDYHLPKRKKWDWNDLLIWLVKERKQIKISEYFSNNLLDIVWI